MRERQEMVTCRSSFTFTTATRSLIFMLVFCFAGCAAGSCLSYGHTCWGAHGKRSGSYSGNSIRPLATGLTEDGDRDAAVPSSEDQWVLSRLVTRQLNIPSTGRLRVKWYDASKVKGLLPSSWDSEESAIAEKSHAFHREEADDDNYDEDNGREIEGTMEIPREILEPQEETEEVLLVPPREMRSKQMSQSHKLRLFKILRSATGNLK